MTIKPAYLLDEISLEEILEDLKMVSLEYENLSRKMTDETTKPLDIKLGEKELSEYLVNKILPIAKSIPYFKYIHAEPKEVYFTDLGKNTFGTRAGQFIELNKRYRGDLVMPSILSHETIHILGGATGESLAMLLGFEVDARMVSEGYECHRTSLCKYLRDVIFQASLTKARNVNQLDGWKNFIKELYGDEFSEERIDKNIENNKKMDDDDIFGTLSDYAVVPYLSIKGAEKTRTDYVFKEYNFDGLERKKVEIPALIEIWNELMTNRRGIEKHPNK